MEIKHLQKQLAVADDRVTAKANELLRLAAVKVPQATLRQGEVARSAICFELACSALSQPVDRQAVVRLSGASDKAYAQAMNLMQKLLGLKPKLTARDLCIQFGCVRMEAAALRALALYKQRFLAQLTPAARTSADFSRPAFIAAAFYLSARKAKLKVDRAALLQRHGIGAGEFAKITSSMADLCFDDLGVTSKRRTPDHAEDRQPGPSVNASTSEVKVGSIVDTGRQPRPSKQRKQQDCQALDWTAAKSRPKALSLNELKQTTLSWGNDVALELGSRH